jgi:uncharacterized membrane protein YjdF
MTFWSRKFLEALLPAILVYFFQFVATLLNVYIYIPYYDTPMHVLGGVGIGMGMWHLGEAAREKRLWSIRSRGLYIFLIVVSTISVAVLWEWYEFIVDSFNLLRFQGTVGDTMKDLFCGMIGALGMAIWLTKDKK